MKTWILKIHVKLWIHRIVINFCDPPLCPSKCMGIFLSLWYCMSVYLLSCIRREFSLHHCEKVVIKLNGVINNIRSQIQILPLSHERTHTSANIYLSFTHSMSFELCHSQNLQGDTKFEVNLPYWQSIPYYLLRMEDIKLALSQFVFKERVVNMLQGLNKLFEDKFWQLRLMLKDISFGKAHFTWEALFQFA